MAFKLTDFNKLASKHGLYLTKYYGYFAWGFTNPNRYEDVPSSVYVCHFNHLSKKNWLWALDEADKFLNEEKI